MATLDVSPFPSLSANPFSSALSEQRVSLSLSLNLKTVITKSILTNASGGIKQSWIEMERGTQMEKQGCQIYEKKYKGPLNILFYISLLCVVGDLDLYQGNWTCLPKNYMDVYQKILWKFVHQSTICQMALTTGKACKHFMLIPCVFFCCC